MPGSSNDDRRVVVVTGSSTGIGLEIATRFAAAGDRVVLCARNSQALDEAEKQILEAHGEAQVLAIQVDVGSIEDTGRLAREVAGTWGNPGILVNNAGIQGPIGLTHEIEPEDWLETMRVNLFGAFLASRAFIPGMIDLGGGKIINLSGGVAVSPLPRYSAYASSKAALVRLTENLAHELADFNIQVNAVAPGMVATRMHQATLAAGERAGVDYLKRTEQMLASGGADPKRAADLAYFLASDESDGISGRIISAIFDDWESMGKFEDGLQGSDLYTLRRIDNMFYRQVSPEEEPGDGA